MKTIKLEPSESKTITLTDERMAILNGDPVWSFFKKVNENSVARDYWKRDFQRAFYDAAHEEINQYAIALIERSESKI